MLNKIWALVLPSAISTYNMIIMRTFFENTIPNELIRGRSLGRLQRYHDLLPHCSSALRCSVRSYGAVLWRCAVEQLVPGIAVHSGSFSVSLQMILREVLIQSDIGNMAGSTGDVEVKRSEICHHGGFTLPIMCLYPFLQKYSAVGVTIGAVKG